MQKSTSKQPYIFEMETTVSYDEIKQKVITQAKDYHRVKAYTP